MAFGATVQKLIAALELDDRKFKSGAASAERSLSNLERKTSTFGRVGSEAGRGLGVAAHNLKTIGVIGGGLAFVGITKSIKAASDLNESINKVNVVFGDASDSVLAFSETTSSSLGLSQNNALEAAGAFGNMFNTIGLAQDASAEMSTNLVTLAADMASFNNEDPTEMLLRLRSGLAGEAEPLRRFGVLISAARVEEEAYASGIAKTGEVLTEQQKVQARYQLILKDTAVQQGDFARTSDGVANSQRRLRANLEDAAATIGTALLPAIETLSAKALALLEDSQPAIEQFASQLPAAFDQLMEIAENLPWEAIGTSLQVAGAGAKTLLSAFTGMPDWVQTAVLTGWGLNKLTGGALGNIAGMLGKGAFGALRGSTPATPVFTKEVGLGGAAGPLGGGKFGGVTKLLGAAFGVTLAAGIADALEDPSESLASSISKELFPGGAPLEFLKPDEWQWPLGNKNPPSWLPDFLQDRPEGTATPLGQFNAANMGGVPASGAPQRFKGEVDDIPRVREEIRALRDDNRSYDAADSQRFASLEQRLIKDKSFAQELTPERFIALLRRTSEFGEKGKGTSIEVGRTTGRDPFGAAFLALARRLPAEHLKDRTVMGELRRHIVAAEELQADAIEKGDVEAARKLQRTIDGIHALLGSQDRTTRGIERLEAEARTKRTQDGATAARTHQHLQQIESVDRTTASNVATNTGVLERKNFNPTINTSVEVNSTISVNDVVRAAITQRVAQNFHEGLD